MFLIGFIFNLKVGVKVVNKITVFAFDGKSMCFAHVLLDSPDMHERGKINLEFPLTDYIRESTNHGLLTAYAKHTHSQHVEIY
jgi:hypothetical protein